jgi:hypothetical protein
MLRKGTGPRGDEVTGHWRKLHNEELFDLYFSLDIINVIKLRGMSWAGGERCLLNSDAEASGNVGAPLHPPSISFV